MRTGTSDSAPSSGLDGEMVVDRGTIFQVPFSGRAFRVAPTEETPFCGKCTFFDADKTFRVTKRVDARLGAAIDRRLQTTNIFAAVRVTGRFHLQTFAG